MNRTISEVTRGESRRLDAGGGRHWAVVLAAGLVGGVIWGVVARVWMRYIATSPHSTVNGTLLIVIGFGVVGLTHAAIHLGRRRELGRPALTLLRVVGVVSLLPLSFGAGASAFPVIIFAPLAITQTTWSARKRGVAAVLALVPAVLVAASIFDDFAFGRAAVGTAWFVVIYAVIVWTARMSLAPQRDGWTAPVTLRTLGVVAVLPVPFFATVALLMGD